MIAKKASGGVCCFELLHADGYFKNQEITGQQWTMPAEKGEGRLRPDNGPGQLVTMEECDSIVRASDAGSYTMQLWFCTTLGILFLRSTDRERTDTQDGNLDERNPKSS